MAVRLVRWPTLVVFREVTRWHRCDRVARPGGLAHRLPVLPVRVCGDGRSLAAPLFDLFADLHRADYAPVRTCLRLWLVLGMLIALAGLLCMVLALLWSRRVVPLVAEHAEQDLVREPINSE